MLLLEKNYATKKTDGNNIGDTWSMDLVDLNDCCLRTKVEYRSALTRNNF